MIEINIRPKTRALLALSLPLCFSALILDEANAFPGRESQVPNNQWGCGLCHQSAGGGGARTVFGEDVKSFGTDGANVSWAALCDRDSDGDGFSNSIELGDPDCTWMIGDPDPSAMVTNPNDAESAPSTEAPEPAGEEVVEAEDSDDSGCEANVRPNGLIWFVLIMLLGLKSR
jgi:hypothetical protein